MKHIQDVPAEEGLHRRLGMNMEAVIVGREILIDAEIDPIAWIEQNAERLNLPEDAVLVQWEIDKRINGYWFFVSHPTFYRRMLGHAVHIRHVEPAGILPKEVTV